MRKSLLILLLVFSSVSWAGIKPIPGEGIAKKPKVFVLSVGYEGEKGVQKVMENTAERFYCNQYFPACATDAKGLSRYIESLQGKTATGIDSVFTFTYTAITINLGTLYEVFRKIQDKITADDIFVFYYASGSWGLSYNDELGDREGFYALNPKVFSNFDVNEDAFTLRHLKLMTDRLRAGKQLIIFDTGNGEVIQNDFYRNFFNDNSQEAGFTRKDRVIICPEKSSSEGFDSNGGVVKGDLFRVISNLPDKASIFSIFDTIPGSWGSLPFPETRMKLFMQEYWKQQLNTVAQLKILRERDYISLLKIIKPGLAAGKRGMKILSKALPPDSSLLRKKKIALIIGTNKYESPSWPTLINPVNDGDSIANILSSRYGYTVKTLFNMDRASIMQAINDLSNDTAVNPYSQYIVYVAGHGYYDPKQKAGFIVCKDSKSFRDVNKPSLLELESYIDYFTLFRRLGTDLNRVILITDVCFGGTSYNSLMEGLNQVDPANEDNRAKTPFQKVLASGITEVDDFMRSNTGAISKNSPFASSLLATFKKGIPDMLNFDKIYAELINAKLKPKPVEFSFGRTSISGDFIF